MQKMSASNDSRPRRDSTECECYEGVQTYMGITENTLEEVHFERGDLLEFIVSPSNMNAAYRRVVSNGGSGGIDKVGVEALLPYLRCHKDELVSSLMDGRYRPNPVRRVEIPKDKGKMRQLGIPTVVDRTVQQSISQVLSLIYERQFSDSSFGFRPHRGCHDALRRALSYLNEGYVYCISLDLERFFDTVNHSKLIEILSRTVRDGRVVSLIHKYLNAGVMVDGCREEIFEGVPQGGPLSPLLSNVMLNELDKCLEARGHRYVRYADDCMIFCKSRRAAERVRDSITKYVECRLLLKVNRDKTVVGYAQRMKYLGYSFYKNKEGWRLSIHPKSVARIRSRLKVLTGRSNGMGYDRRKKELHSYVRGVIGYFHLADMKNRLQDMDEWLRRRIRMCLWKSWKRPKTREKRLLECGVKPYAAKQTSNFRIKYWRSAKSHVVHAALSNDWLRIDGYPCLMDYYVTMHRS